MTTPPTAIPPAPSLYFLDTNALVQGYLPHSAGTDRVRQLLNKRAGAIPVYITELARVEFRSALYKLERVYETHPSFTDALINRFDRDVRLSLDGAKQRLYTAVPFSTEIVDRARDLLRVYRTGKPQALRSLDALQLATALLAREALPIAEQSGMAMVTSDRQLAGVSTHEGLIVVRPEGNE